MRNWFTKRLAGSRFRQSPSPSIQVDADAAPSHRNLGDLARNRGDRAAAIHHYLEHLRTHPDDFSIWVQVGHAMKDQGLFEAADEAYGRASQLAPENADLWLHRGHLAKLREDHAAALGFYDRSYAIDQNTDAVIEIYGLGLSPSSGRGGRDPGSAGTGRATRIVGAVTGFDGTAIRGWVSDPEQPDGDPVVEVLRDDIVIASGSAPRHPEAVTPSRVAPDSRPFQIDVDGVAEPGETVSLRLRRTGEPLEGSPYRLHPSLEAQAWLARLGSLDDDDLKRRRARFDEETDGLVLSIVMIVDSLSIRWLSEAVDSVKGQWCSRWELLLVPASSLADPARGALAAIAGGDHRIRWVPAVDVPAQLKAHTLFMSAGEVLEPEAVFRFLDAARADVELIYCDQMEIAEHADDIRAFDARPGFSLDHYLSCPDLGALICVRSDLVRSLVPGAFGGAETGVRDLWLRVLPRLAHIAHIPAFLARRRRSSPVIADADHVLDQLNQYLETEATGASARAGRAPGIFRIDYPDDPAPTVIIIPTRDRVELLEPCVSSILSTTDEANVKLVIIDHASEDPRTLAYLKSLGGKVEILRYEGVFNYARMNNDAASRFAREAKYIVFANNDLEFPQSGWLERLRSLAARSDVGVVGPTLLFPDNRVQHVGLVLGVGGPAHHTNKFAPFGEDLRPLRRRDALLTATRETTAVTGACMVMKSRLFFDIGGFDIDMAVDFNDVDLCMRLASCGYRVLHDGQTVLYHHESATRAKPRRVQPHAERALFVHRWRDRLAQGDAFYSPLMSKVADHELGDFTQMYHPVRVRPVRPERTGLDRGRPRKVPAASHFP